MVGYRKSSFSPARKHRIAHQNSSNNHIQRSAPSLCRHVHRKTPPAVSRFAAFLQSSVPVKCPLSLLMLGSFRLFSVAAEHCLTSLQWIRAS